MLRQIEQALHLIAQHGVEEVLWLWLAAGQILDQLLRADLETLRDPRLIEKLPAHRRLQLREALEAERLRRAHDRGRIDADLAGDLGDGQVDDIDAALEQEFRHLLLAGR